MKFLHVHRVDPSNVGDVFCAPYRYFDFGQPDVADILEVKDGLGEYDAVLLGGGGLGTGFFKAALTRLEVLAGAAGIPIVVWGAGVDVAKNRKGGIISKCETIDLFGDYFSGSSLRGVRVFQDPMPTGYEWVPCVSCMHETFDMLRLRKPSKRIGYYLHKSIRGNVLLPDEASKESNRGRNIDQKLAFLADHEYIITNTYHGTYWATLLGRKVVCVPFKSGLFSFKHRPSYSSDWAVTEELLDSATAYPDSLEECREVNMSFYGRLMEMNEQ